MTKKESKEKRIEDILEAAVDVFIEKGYENTSMNEIAAKAGISKGGLYHHFLSKDLILLYANQKLMEPINEYMSEAKNIQNAKEALKYYISSYIKHWVTHKRELIFFSLSMTKAMSQMDILKLYEKFTEDYINFFEELYKRGIEQGEMKIHDARGSGLALMSALDGVVIYMALDRKLRLEDTTNRFQETFVDSLSV